MLTRELLVHARRVHTGQLVHNTLGDTRIYTLLVQTMSHRQVLRVTQNFSRSKVKLHFKGLLILSC